MSHLVCAEAAVQAAASASPAAMRAYVMDLSPQGLSRHANMDSHARPMAVLDRPRRDVHRRRRAPPRRHARDPQAAVGEPRAVSRRGDRRHPPLPRRGRRRADPGRADRGGEDGHHGRHQRAPRAQGRAHGALHHPRLPRPAAHRLPEPAAHLRPPHPHAGAALPRSGRGRRAHGRARRRGAAARRGAGAARARGRPLPRASARSPSSSCTAIVFPPHEARVAELAREAGFEQVSVSHAREPAHEDRLARGHDGGRCVSLADPAALRGPGGGRAAGGAA